MFQWFFFFSFSYCAITEQRQFESPSVATTHLFLDLDKKIPVLINLGISHFSTTSLSQSQSVQSWPSFYSQPWAQKITQTHATNTMSFSAFNSMNIQVSMIDSWKGNSFLFVDFLKVTSIYGSESRRSSSTSDKITFNCCGTKNSNQKQVRNDFS